MDSISRKKNNAPKCTLLTMEQVQTLLAAARRADREDLETLLLLALVTGMRRGELLGLKWMDIDFAQGALQVQRSLQYISSNKWVEAAPKTERDQRRIELPTFMVEALHQHREQQELQRLRAGMVWQERGYVFTRHEGRPLDPFVLIRQFARLLEDAGLPHMRFHDLRYSANHLTFQ